MLRRLYSQGNGKEEGRHGKKNEIRKTWKPRLMTRTTGILAWDIRNIKKSPLDVNTNTLP